MSTHTISPNGRPKAATVIAVLSIVFACVNAPWQLYFVRDAFAHGNFDPNRGVIQLEIADLILCFLNIPELLAGIFLLANTRFGRLLAFAYAIVSLIVASYKYALLFMLGRSGDPLLNTIAYVFYTAIFLGTVGFAAAIITVLRKPAVRDFYAP